MKWIRSLSLIMLFIAFHENVNGQSDSVLIEELQQQVSQLEANLNKVKPGISSFLLTGFTNLTYHQDMDDKEVSKFDHAGFSPIMLWRPSDKIFFEAELHIEMEGGVHGGEIDGDHSGGHGHGGDEVEAGHEGSTHIDLGYANMVYLIRPNIIFNAGKFLSPIGIYNERYHPTWINPLPVDPLGMGHGGPIPAAELGIQFRGGLQAGASKITYAVYMSNGPILNEGNNDNDSAGKLIYSNFSDNNANKAFGGRFSYLPFQNSSLEIGFSGQYAHKIGDRNTKYEDVNASIYAFDLTFIKNINSFGLIRMSGQYAAAQVGDAEYQNTLEEILNGAPVLYTFDNRSNYYYVSASLRPIQNSKKLIRNSEIVLRYEAGTTPENSKWHIDENRILIGYTYWLHARTAFKVATSIGDENVLYIQLALGF